MRASAADLLRWAESLSAIARTGLGFTQSLYERERFEEVLKVAADIRAAAIDEAESRRAVRGVVEHRRRGRRRLRHAEGRGRRRRRATSDKEILLTQRADSGWWLYPVGWADVGYSASEIAMKEVLEETGSSASRLR